MIQNSNITISSIKTELGESANSVSRLCTSEKINKFSKYKPIRNTSSVWYEGIQKSDNYGLVIPQAYRNTCVSDVKEKTLIYNSPRGHLYNEPYRLGDYKYYSSVANKSYDVIYPNTFYIGKINDRNNLVLFNDSPYWENTVPIEDLYYSQPSNYPERYLAVLFWASNYTKSPKIAVSEVPLKNRGNQIVGFNFPNYAVGYTGNACVCVTDYDGNFSKSGTDISILYDRGHTIWCYPDSIKRDVTNVYVSSGDSPIQKKPTWFGYSNAEGDTLITNVTYKQISGYVTIKNIDTDLFSHSYETGNIGYKLNIRYEDGTVFSTDIKISGATYNLNGTSNTSQMLDPNNTLKLYFTVSIDKAYTTNFDGELFFYYKQGNYSDPDWRVTAGLRVELKIYS